MSNPTSLNQTFEATKSQLADALSGLTLPSDAQRIEAEITAYLNEICHEQSDYRQNLTQSEDYILQGALEMLNAQRALVAVLQCPQKPAPMPEQPTPAEAANPAYGIIGAGGGALAGKLILGGWGAVFGAIAGTAVALYLSQNRQVKSHRRLPSAGQKSTTVEIPLNTAALLEIIGQTCTSLDHLIATFRAQIQRVAAKYESSQKPSLESDFLSLLENVQTLIGYKRGHTPADEKYLGKLQLRIEDLAETLDNYGLEAIDYTPARAQWFETVESANATEIKPVKPALVKKDGTLVLPGKIFVPAKL